MKKIIVDGCAYIPCTAIAVSIGDTERQNAVYGVGLNQACGREECVIYGYDIEEIDFATLQDIGNQQAFSTEASDLDTVLFEDGTRPSDYVSFV